MRGVLIDSSCRGKVVEVMQNEYHLRLSSPSGKLLIVSDKSDVPLVDANVDTLGIMPIAEDWLSYGWAPGVNTATIHNKDGSITTITADEETLTKRTSRGGGSDESISKVQVVDSSLHNNPYFTNYWRTFEQESSTDFMQLLRGMSVTELKRLFHVLLRIQQGISAELVFRISNFKDPKITVDEWQEMLNHHF